MMEARPLHILEIMQIVEPISERQYQIPPNESNSFTDKYF